MPQIPLPEIPMPHVLDDKRVIRPESPDDTLEDHRTRAQTLQTTLTRTCEYGQTMHQRLAAVRTYLADHVPADSADSEAWASWRALYGSVVSTLAGPHGDDGFGPQEATQIAEQHGAAGIT